MMNGGIDGWMSGWGGGGMWALGGIGLLVVVLLAVMVGKMSSKKP